MARCCTILIVIIASLTSCGAEFLVSTCTQSEFRCNDGTCINPGFKCNGVENCPDGSDEDFVICRKNECRNDQFQCVYGACVRGDAACDGVKDCADYSDELLLQCRNETTYVKCIDEVLKSIVCAFTRCPKHLSSVAQRDNYMKQCEQKERSCKDGELISLKQKCDGTIHCKDGSDESLRTCATNRCFIFEFRCKNGACVDSSTMCDGVKNCADGSDELDDLCHVNKTGLCVLPPYPKFGFYNVIDNPFAHPDQTFESVHLNYSCHVGYKLDGPDSISCMRSYWSHTPPSCVSRCVLEKHPSVEYLCLPKNTTSQSAKECENLVEDGTAVRPKCREPGFEFKGVLVNMHCNNGQWDHIIVCTPVNEGMCFLPPYPNNGYYTAGNLPNVHPGLVIESVHLNYTCHSGYKLIGVRSPYCDKGWWSEKPPECVSQCQLHKHVSVEYLCLPKNFDSRYGAAECEELVEDGTVVRATCRTDYYDSGVLGNMHCIDGVWDYVKICLPQCGLVTPVGEQMVLGGRSAKRGELPWHAGIYKKTKHPYMQICGGSLISTTVIISAAHCFWTELEKQLPASNFAVAVGKLYRPWDDPNDEDAQKSDVRDIKIPKRFQGSASNFQDDIAVVIVVSSFSYRTYVRPVCVDIIEINFNRRQLHVGASGKVAGWGLTAEDGQAAPQLRVVELPYVEIDECISASPASFLPFITSDKICAGVINDLDLIITYHCCERSMEVSKQVLDLHCTLRSVDSFAVFFRDRCFDKKVEFALNTVLFAPLPTPTVYGYRAIYARLLDPDARNFFFNEVVRVFMMVFDLWQYEEGTWPGFVLIIDMDQATMGHIGKLEVMTIKKVLYFLQECMLIKLKGIHFRNAPHFVDKLMMLLKPFLKKALLDIIFIHPTGSDTICECITKDAFPKEDGGMYKDRETIKEETIKRLKANQAFYQEENLKRVNETLRPGGKTNVQDMFGIQGSFKKLDID